MAPGSLLPRGPEPAAKIAASLCRVACCLALAAGLVPGFPGMGKAQSSTPFVVDEWRYGTRESNAVLSYCIDARDPDRPVARAIAAAVAAALLLNGKEYVIAGDPRTADMSGEDMDDTYRLLIEHCDVIFGFKLVPDAYPVWLTITRPYYRASYVYVVANAAWHALSDMPVNQPIGATIGTSADLRLSQYILAVPPGHRWDKYPMASDEAALRAVVKGTTGAALVWAPAVWALHETSPEFDGLNTIAPSPLPVSTADVGAILLSKQSFLRNSIDQAIASLTRDGTIAAILRQAKFPGTPVP